MKTTAWILALTALAITSCTSQKKATTYVDDDVYLPASPPAKVAVAPAPKPATGEQIVVSPDEAKAQKPVSSTFEEDYNDYSYTDRINRFNNKDTTAGYFSQSSSGSSGSSSPDINLYFGAGSWYGGYYGPYYSMGIGWGNPYWNYPYWGWDYGWGYPYWGNPYWGYPYYYYGYAPWYNPCYCCYGNYYDWYNPYYTSTGYYYGSRKTLSRSSGGGTSANARSATDVSSTAMNRTMGQSVSTTPRPGTGTERTTQTGQEKYRYTRPSAGQQAMNQRSGAPATTRTQDKTVRQQPAPKYVRPETVSPASRSGSAQSYSSPVYRQPKSSQEYLAPRNQNPGTSETRNTGVQTRTGSSGSVMRQGTSPAIERNSNPSRSGSREYSAPRNSGPTYSTPSRSESSGSYSSPSRSGNSGSYSAPSRSGSSGSYSAPSRSGGSGSSSPSSGSSGGGGRHR